MATRSSVCFCRPLNRLNPRWVPLKIEHSKKPLCIIIPPPQSCHFMSIPIFTPGEFDFSTQKLKMKHIKTPKQAAKALQDPYTNFVHVGKCGFQNRAVVWLYPDHTGCRAGWMGGQNAWLMLAGGFKLFLYVQPHGLKPPARMGLCVIFPFWWAISKAKTAMLWQAISDKPTSRYVLIIQSKHH